MKKKIYITAVIAAVLSAFSSCAQTKPEVKPAFAESTEKSISRSEVQGTSRSEVQSAEQITEQSAELAAQTSEPELIPLTMTEAETTTLTTEEQMTAKSVTSATETFASMPEETSPAKQTNAQTTENVSLPQTAEPARKVLFNYDPMVPDERYKEFYSKCVFVGDSICRGFKAYDVLPARQVCAQGNTAARNILEFEFRVDGQDADLITCLKKLDPEYIVFSMGMNDVNMTSKEKFCENYGNLLSLTEQALPEAQLVVCSVTPIVKESNFTRNTKIDEYNAALKEYLDASGRWIFADIAHGLKDKDNGLKSRYNGGDGIHLSGLAYHAILYQVAERVLDRIEYDEEGRVVHLDAPVTEEQTEEAAQTDKEPDADTTGPA